MNKLSKIYPKDCVETISNIVVISPNLNLVQRLKDQLPDEQVSWLWAGDGRLGLDVISNVSINIAVVDSLLEGQKDLELIGAIKAWNPMCR